ncbi:beta-glucosidase [Granulicella rosea]|uniref:Beta-glucosidase n=1 Tax=Granulicella rosea TaxID=474952 RepID=A0A239M208_9BACT|nr:glycoside hydrolase family 3 C-terminal domain-containing protein [Granulicella rosea]SNT36685.1 beta-glucosidase [Granulicella rosea]
MRTLLLATFVLAGWTPAAFGQTDPAYKNPALTPEARAHDLVSRMTLEEKAMQSINTAPAIPRLGVPAYDFWSEGLHGVARSGYSTLFPQAIGMAATWDAPLLGRIGEVVSTEARAKYNEAVRNDVHSIYFGLTIWSPNINIFRDPRWGRGQETYGEDPYLTGTLGQRFIEGLQGPDPLHPRVVATPKHFAVHSGPENVRHKFNVDPSPHDLWDTYLPQFRRAIVDAKADSIMCAYNAVDGKPACASDLLLNDILRKDWKFTGFITSDCGAVDDFFEKNAHQYSPDKEHAAATGVLLGTDTNCGSTYKALPDAVKAGLLKESDLDRTLERLFVARFRLGLFDPPAKDGYGKIPFSEDRSPEHLALSLKTAHESMVLLKNDGILPLAPGRYKRIAVIGPNAASLSALEGNYNAVPKNPQMPVEALRAAFTGAKVIFAEGAPYADGVPLPVPSTMLRQPTGNGAGLRAEYFAGAPEGKPAAVRTDDQIDFDWNSASPVAGLKQDDFAVRWTGYLLPPMAGDLEFNMRLAHCYPCGDREHFTVKIDGREVSAYGTSAEEGRESTTPRFHVNFADTRPHRIEVVYTHSAPLFGGGITLEWVPPAGVLQKEAVAAAQASDLVVAMVGLSPELEGEEMKIQVPGFAGGDRTDIQLPASQVKMLQDVAATGKPMVVVLLNGSALAVNWAQEHANAILEAWYPGEFGGKAIADTLLGRNNPAGRLPVTFYASVDDIPAFDDYAMKNRTYRYFTGTPLYRFGYGLSYTRFAYANLKIDHASLSAGDTLTATVEVKNTGPVAGEEVAQLYLVPPAAGNGGLSPHLQLEGYQRVSLKPGESRKLTFTLSPRDLSEVDAQGVRSVQPGSYSVAVGGAQPGDKQAPAASVSAQFTIAGTAAIAR